MWAIKLNYTSTPSLAGVWFWPKLNCLELNGTALFQSRAQARYWAHHYDDHTLRPKLVGSPVRVYVTVETVMSDAPPPP